MLSYRHSFHAGNHADVLKHIVLTIILESLTQKEKGFFYLDTHAGVGLYRLGSFEAQKTSEYLTGIGRLWEIGNTQDNLPKPIFNYVNLIRQFNFGNKLTNYAGSPMLVAKLLRPQDRATFCELHPTDYPLLRQNFNAYKNITTKRENGFQQLKSALPPKERRGLVLIDPSYEIKEDYDLVVKYLQEGYKRFATGIYAIWYPVVKRSYIKKMVRDLEATGIRKILQIELAVRPDNTQKGMTASGMIIINPPWQLASQMNTILPYLNQNLTPEGTGSWTLKWITPE